MLSRALMKGYESFESGYARVLSVLARNRVALALVGRWNQQRNLVDRVVRRQVERTLSGVRIPTASDLEDVLSALARVERSHRRIEQQIEDLKQLLSSSEGGR